MEERIIDDEYGRGIRLKKTAEGYIDVTDELSEDDVENVGGTEEGEEISFAFPVLGQNDEDDEDMVGLSPEEALALRKKKEEEALALKQEYEQLCQEGIELLETQSYKAAELKFEKALQKDKIATDASVGYWRAKTADFTDPDMLIEEYLEVGFENLEYDLGYEAVEIIKKEYRPSFEQRVADLTEQETPLAAEIGEKQENRRVILKERIKKSLTQFIVTALPMLITLILTILFATKIRSTPDGRFIWYTVGAGIAFIVAFCIFGTFANKLINDLRINRENENLASTVEGELLLEIREYKQLYQRFLD